MILVNEMIRNNNYSAGSAHGRTNVGSPIRKVPLAISGTKELQKLTKNSLTISTLAVLNSLRFT